MWFQLKLLRSATVDDSLQSQSKATFCRLVENRFIFVFIFMVRPVVSEELITKSQHFLQNLTLVYLAASTSSYFFYV